MALSNSLSVILPCTESWTDGLQGPSQPDPSCEWLQKPLSTVSSQLCVKTLPSVALIALLKAAASAAAVPLACQTTKISGSGILSC